MLKGFYGNTKPENKRFFIKIVSYDKNHLPLGLSKFSIDLADIYLSKINNGNTTERREICSKLIIRTLERRHWH